MQYLDLIVTGLIAAFSSIVISEIYHRRSLADSKNSISKLREDTDKFRDSVVNHIQSIDQNLSESSQALLGTIQKEIRILDLPFESKKYERVIIIMLAIYFFIFFALSFYASYRINSPVPIFVVLTLYFIISRPVFIFLRKPAAKKERRMRYEKFDELIHKYKLSYNEKAAIEKWISRSQFDYLDQDRLLKAVMAVPIHIDAEYQLEPA